MKLAFDIDGCLAWFTKGYADLIRKTSGRDLLTEEMILNPPCWNWDLAAGYTKEEEKACWNLIFNELPYFWMDLSPIPGLDKEFWHQLDILSDKHDVYFLTHRAGIRAKQQTESWLYGQGIDLPTVILTGDKLPILKSIGIDAFIDDKPSTLEEVAASDWKGKLFKVNYKYNEGTPGRGVASVADMLKELNLCSPMKN